MHIIVFLFLTQSVYVKSPHGRKVNIKNFLNKSMLGFYTESCMINRRPFNCVNLKNIVYYR